MAARYQTPAPRPAAPASWASPISNRAAIEDMRAGCIAVVDDDGAVLIPADLLDEMLVLAPEQERLKNWTMGEVENGAALPGLYPPNAENKARYAATMAQQ